MRCTLTYYLSVLMPQKAESRRLHNSHQKKNPRLNLTQKEKMKNELMSEAGAEYPKKQVV